ncbi:hypothetical protein ACG04R_23275 [Roseateles sp. BYS78W]|uniref:Uncharacterized protein n=1 Tax=Pelomonas candidula TaxID=3299025 RepID=A0ABW7HI66_9BURK
MAGTSYSRTAGHAILPGTWEFVRRRGNVPDSDLLDPAERYDYDTVNADKRAEFDRLAARDLTEPPEFLQFALANGRDALSDYPGAAPLGTGAVALDTFDPALVARAAAKFGMTAQKVEDELRKFSGAVQLVELLPGQELYRTVGLTATGALYGSVTNKILGNYWEPVCPDEYDDVGHWRASTAVLAEWNGDYGYVRVQLARPVAVLAGTVGQQDLNRQPGQVLPGGAQQFFIPRLVDADLVTPVTGQPLKNIIRRTVFGARTRGTP